MSIEANTCEELTIHNVNEKTAQLCDAVSEYLLKTWGIISISLTVDGNTYESAEDDSIKEGSELQRLCKDLVGAKEIHLCLRSCNGGGVYWRIEDCFMKYFTDDSDLKDNVTYRSTDYYDTDPGVDMYLYNENGLQRLGYNDSADSVADIKEWYCYTPEFRITDEDQMGNAELHEGIMAIVAKLCELFGLTEEDMENGLGLDDNWDDYGEIIQNGSVRFTTDSIPQIVSLANQLIALLKDAESA